MLLVVHTVDTTVNVYQYSQSVMKLIKSKMTKWVGRVARGFVDEHYMNNFSR